MKILTAINPALLLSLFLLFPSLSAAQPTLHIYGPGLESYSSLNPSATILNAEELRKQPQRSLDELLEVNEALLSFRRGSSIYAHPATQGASFRGTAATAASRTLVEAAAELLTGRLQADYVSAQYEDDLNRFQLQSYFTLNARLSYSVNERTVVFFEGENLLDQDIEAAKTADGLVSYAPPLQLRVGIELSVR